MSLIRKCDAALMTLIALSLIATLILTFANPEYFWRVFAAEDGPVEYATALFLLVASLILVVHAVSLWRKGRHGAAILTAVYALIFFMAAGEEVSWGQRIFGWQSGEFFNENNKQHETNLHNMKIDGVQLASTVFGPFLTFCILLYLVVLPLLYRQGRWIKALADRMAVPVPWLRHGIIAILASLVIGLIGIDRRWEVYELIFSLLMVSIFLLPQNPDKTR